MNKDFSGQVFPFSISNSKHYLILFLIWPFMAFLLAIRNYSQKESRRVVYLFLIYYGLTFVVGNVGVDAERYALILKSNAELPFSDFFKIVGGLYTSDSSVDIVEPLISFIVSRFTSHHSVLFAAFAALFGFFYLKSINLLHNRYLESPGSNALIFMAFFTLVLPITTINGFRMWTATWVFFYGAYHVILYRDKRFLLIALASSLIHWSFLSANVILIMYFFVGNRNFIYFPLTIASFVLPQLIAPVFQLISLRLGGSIQHRYDGYSNEDYILARQGGAEESVWFMQIGTDLVFFYLILAIIVIQLKAGFSKDEKQERNLFSFLLLFLAFVNFGTAIPSFGSRFQLVFFLFATLYIFQYLLKLPGNKINLLTWLGILPMLIYVAITFRLGSDSISAWILTPGLGLPLFVPELSFADFLFH